MPRQSAARASDPGAASHVQDGQQLAAAKRLRLNRLRVLAGMCWSVPGRTAKSCLPARDPKMFSFFRFVCEATGGESCNPHGHGLWCWCCVRICDVRSRQPVALERLKLVPVVFTTTREAQLLRSSSVPYQGGSL